MSDRAARLSPSGGGRLPLALFLAATAFLALADSAEARTRKFCSFKPFYSGKSIGCGGHLEPFCTSGAKCDSGHNEYSGSPFPITVDCPTIRDPITGWVVKDIPDVKVNGGCYNRIPTCNDCGGAGQVPCPAEAEPICDRGCDPGLESNPTTTLCEVPGSPGSPCGPGYPCGKGLSCDPLSFVCVEKLDAGEFCGDPFRSCKEGLQCTLALTCSHTPAREGETCDVTAPCGDGLFCQPGIPQRCRAYRKPGEGCSAVNPCIEGSSCEACFTESCSAPFQCFPNGNGGAITEQQCRAMYSPGDAALAEDLGATLTYAAGNGVGLIAGEAQSFGVVYGQDGSYGCYTSFCYGLDFDVSINHFISIGFYNDYPSVDGYSWASFESVSLPGDVVSFTTSQVFARDDADDLTPGALIGTEDAFGLGIGPNPIPVSAGVFLCEAVVDTLIDGDGSMPPPPPTPSAPSGRLENADFDRDLSGWSCDNLGRCTWISEDPFFSTISGAASVTSPSAQANPGRLLSSCVHVEGEEELLAETWLRATGAVEGYVRVYWFASDDCSGQAIVDETMARQEPHGDWERWSLELVAPAAARSVRLSAEAYRGSDGAPSTLEIDAVSLPEPGRGALSALTSLIGLGLLRRARRRRS